MTVIATNGGVAAQRQVLPRWRPVDDFGDLIGVVRAHTQEQLDSAFRLRFQVYCVERGFEDAARYPDGREHDHDDSRSMHCLLMHRPTDLAVGTVRLILPHSDAALPVSRVVGSQWHDLDLPAETTAEISRFAIAKTLRRHFDRGDAVRVACGEAQRNLPMLTLGLIQAVVMMGRSRGITHVVAMMAPALHHLLARFGVEFQPIGEPVDHHGLRQPGWAAVSDLPDTLRHLVGADLLQLAAESVGRASRQLAAA